MTTVAVCIPSIPVRPQMLTRAIASVARQDRQPDAVTIAVDHAHDGAAHTRNRAWEMAGTDFIAFLDDDDELLPHHLAHLLDVQAEHDADVVYPWHRIIGPDGRQLADLLRGQGIPFDPDELDNCNYIPVTTLIRRELLADVGGIPIPGTPDWPHADCEDWALWRRIRDAGGKFVHTPEVTWLWHHHGKNTSGQGNRWGTPVFS